MKAAMTSQGVVAPMRIATPQRKSTCKRLNMFLRWMVRKDDKGVDFGLWKKIKPSQLIIPLDVHVDRIARSLKLITRKQTDWLAALELTEQLKLIRPEDPVLFDYALFGLGIFASTQNKAYCFNQFNTIIEGT